MGLFGNDIIGKPLDWEPEKLDSKYDSVTN